MVCRMSQSFLSLYILFYSWHVLQQGHITRGLSPAQSALIYVGKFSDIHAFVKFPVHKFACIHTTTLYIYVCTLYIYIKGYMREKK